MGKVINAEERFLQRRKKPTPVSQQVDFRELQKEFDRLTSDNRTKRLREELAKLKENLDDKDKK